MLNWTWKGYAAVSACFTPLESHSPKCCTSEDLFLWREMQSFFGIFDISTRWITLSAGFDAGSVVQDASNLINFLVVWSVADFNLVVLCMTQNRACLLHTVLLKNISLGFRFLVLTQHSVEQFFIFHLTIFYHSINITVRYCFRNSVEIQLYQSTPHLKNKHVCFLFTSPHLNLFSLFFTHSYGL